MENKRNKARDRMGLCDKRGSLRKCTVCDPTYHGPHGCGNWECIKKHRMKPENFQKVTPTEAGHKICL